MVLHADPPMIGCIPCNRVRVIETLEGGRVRVILTREERAAIRTGPRPGWDADRVARAQQALHTAGGDVMQMIRTPDLQPLWAEARRREHRGEDVAWPYLTGRGARFRSVGQWLAWRDHGAPLPAPLTPEVPE